MTKAHRAVSGLALCALLISACAGGRSWNPAPTGVPVPEDSFLADSAFAQAADSAMAHLRAARQRLGAPALSAAVSVDGRLIWAGTVGWADIEARTAATVATEFRIGSTSKAVTATGLARLVDAGVVALDTPLVRYRERLPNAKWSALTPRQLSSHTAGIPDYGKNRDLRGFFISIRENRRFASATDALTVFDGSGLVATPGTRFLYSSFDVNLVGALIEWRTGRTFPEAMDSLVWAPLNVTGIRAAGHGDSSRSATFYERRGDEWRRWRPVDHTYKWPSGGLLASPSAVARIGAAWFDTTFIAAATREDFWSPQRLTDGQVNEQSYAVGWRSQQSIRLWGANRPVHAVHHGGVSKGSLSWLVLYPEHRVAVAMAMNVRLDDFSPFSAEEPTLTRLFIKR